MDRGTDLEGALRKETSEVQGIQRILEKYK